MILYRDIAWWYWLGEDLLLISGFAGWTNGFYLAAVLGVFQMVHYLILEHSFTAFLVQVRAAYLALLLIGLWPPARFLYVLMVIGTSAIILTGYCFLARALSLLPANRREPFSWKLIKKTLFSPPVRGNILQGLPKEKC